MSLRDAYLYGSDVLSDARAIVIEPDATAETVADLAVQEVERAVAEAEAEERRALAPFEADDRQRVLKSEIPNVSDEAWTRFVFAMKTALPGAVSASNAFGMFEATTRRLADLGLVQNIKRVRSPTGRLVWIGDFVPPLTQRGFLSNFRIDNEDGTVTTIQYKAFVDSIKAYIEGLRTGSVPKPDGGFRVGDSMSGVLAVLHRSGPNGLKNWNDEDERFEDTVALFERANGIF